MSKFRSIATKRPKSAARWSRLFALVVLVGVFGGLAATAFESGLHWGTKLLIGQATHLDSAEVLRFDDEQKQPAVA